MQLKVLADYSPLIEERHNLPAGLLERMLYSPRPAGTGEVLVAVKRNRLKRGGYEYILYKAGLPSRSECMFGEIESIYYINPLPHELKVEVTLPSQSPGDPFFVTLGIKACIPEIRIETYLENLTDKPAEWFSTQFVNYARSKSILKNIEEYEAFQDELTRQCQSDLPTTEAFRNTPFHFDFSTLNLEIRPSEDRLQNIQWLLRVDLEKREREAILARQKKEQEIRYEDEKNQQRQQEDLETQAAAHKRTEESKSAEHTIQQVLKSREIKQDVASEEGLDALKILTNPEKGLEEISVKKERRTDELRQAILDAVNLVVNHNPTFRELPIHDERFQNFIAAVFDKLQPNQLQTDLLKSSVAALPGEGRYLEENPTAAARLKPDMQPFPEALIGPSAHPKGG